MARPGPGTGQNPPSFKTVPGRHRTQKWQVAKQYDYSGDDWGGYDPYDDYEDQPPPQMQSSSGPQSAQAALPSQQQQQFVQTQRQQSFDEGEERRAFSGPNAFPIGERGAASPARSAASRGSNDYPRPRDFTNPEQVPPPLNTLRGSPAPAGPMTAPPAASSADSFPPRKSSTGVSRGFPAPGAVPAPATGKAEKELPTIPFVRPSDIYKRMEAEREKERKSSMDSSSRPSLDGGDQTSLSSQQRPLSKVEEGPGDESMVGSNSQGPLDVPQEFGEPTSRSASETGGPSLPPIKSFSGFGATEMFGSSSRTGTDEKTPTQPATTSFDSLQTTPTATRAPPGSDPAADILAERTHTVPISAIGTKAPDALAHQDSQTSQGYRSMVNRAFDRPDDGINSVPATPVSRDGSQSTRNPSDVSRSNTNSTSSISPIMSRVPSAATAKMQQQQMEQQVPTIAEEPTARASSESARKMVARKPSPSSTARSRNVSQGSDLYAAGVEKGYRRSLDPPSSDNSPAHTPALENTTARRLSEGLAAETVTEERVGRPRAGTDYSMREADIAHNVNSSPEKNEFDAQAAERAQDEQNEFLRMHSPPIGTERTATPPVAGSGRTSPSKGRVRDLADKYQEIDNTSKRNSQALSTKSSWSNFRGSDENLPGKSAKRQETRQSNVVSESDYGGVEEGGLRDSGDDEAARDVAGSPVQIGEDESASRPEMGREQSFRPQLPGQWVSFSSGAPGMQPPTPAVEEEPAPASGGSQHTPRASQQVPESETVDLTRTTRKVPLEGSTAPSDTLLGQAKNVGDALGAAFMSSYGLGHQTRDFGSAAPAPEVEQPTERNQTGELGHLKAPERPEMYRGDTDASVASTMTAASTESNEPPTPPAKDTPAGIGGGGHYFAPAPLRTGYSRETSPESTPNPSVLSTVYGADGLQRDDSLRREIVRSLDTPAVKRERQIEDISRTQDALDAPENMQRVSEGEKTLPATEINDDSPSKPQPLRMLDQRFSWEKREEDKGLLDSTPTKAATGTEKELPRVIAPEPDSSPEIKPEMPYERPRSRGLHIMNTSDDERSSGDEAVGPKTPVRDVGLSHPATAERALEQESVPIGARGFLGSGGPVSPITKSQENLHARSQQIERESGDVRELAPSPISEGGGSVRLPSYYIQDTAGLGLTQQESRDVDTAGAPEVADQGERSTDDTAPVTAPPPPPEKEASSTSPTSPTSGKQKIPPFREILAIKSPQARIQTYDETRRTFADMNTGLSDWLSNMLAQNPEYASLSTEPLSRPAPPLGASSTTRLGHKASPSLARFGRLASGGGSGDPQRSNTVSGGPSSSSAGGEGMPSVDMDKLQQRGKDLMKGAGVLGGKAQAGAKGLLAKGRSRFGTQRESKGGGGFGGGSKAPPPAPSSTSKSPPSAAFEPSSSSLVPSVPSDFSSTAVEPTDLTSTISPPAEPTARSLHSACPGLAAATRPPPRSQTQTPSSVSSASGALSRTLSRLKEGGRSLSRNGSGRSKSRPQSLVLTNSNTTTGSELGTAGDGSLQQGRGIEAYAVSGAGASDVISPWSEPDEVAAVGFERGQERSVTPARLGVLPSPAADGFSIIHEYESPPATAVSGAESKVEGVERSGIPVQKEESSETVAPAENTLAEDAGRPATFLREEKSTSTVSAEGQDEQEEEDELYDTTPKKISPVSTREGGEDDETRELYGAPPKVSLPTTQGEGEKDELYYTTPKKSNFMTARENADDEDLDESTPIAAKPSQQIPVFEETARNADTEEGSDAEQSLAGAADKFETAPGESDETTLPAYQVTGNGREDGDNTVTPRPESISPVQPEENFLKPPATDDSYGKEWDKRSAISSHNDFEDAKEEPNPDGETSSRRSSVSSLDHAGPDMPVMFAQAVPAGPTIQLEEDRAAQDERFMNRPYRYGGGEEERPRSFVPLERDSSGALVQQESLDTAPTHHAESMDLSGFGGPPSGAPPFQQSRKFQEFTVHTKPKRYSGMIKGRRPTLTSPAAEFASASAPGPSAPAPSAISDHFGLEGLQDDAENVVVGEVPSHREPQEQDDRQDKQNKRRSGLWDAFKRSPSVSKTEISRQTSTPRLDSQQNLNTVPATQPRPQPPPKDEGARSGTLKKPQRASTTTNEPEQKKKRFSGFGSLFGRSSTTGHKTDKSKKLTKAPSPGPSINNSQGRAPPQSVSYDGYEAMGRQQAANLQQRQPNTYPPPSIGPPSQQNLHLDTSITTSPEGMPPPAGGWYAPQNQAPLQQRVSEQPPPQYRRLHSEGFRRDPPLMNVPEAFRPVEASFNRPVMPIDAPVEDRMSGMYSPPTSPVSPGGQEQRMPYSQQPPPPAQSPVYGPPQQRHSSYDSEESQISGQSEWQRSDWQHRGSSPSISPVQSRTGSDGYPAARNFRIGSISEEVARSPAREYADQQTPWAIDLPRGARGPRSSSHGMQGGAIPPQAGDYAPVGGYDQAYPPPHQYQPQRGFPMSPRSPGSSAGIQAPELPPVLSQGPMFMSGGDEAYPSPPSPPYSPQSPHRPQVGAGPLRLSEGRYYAQAAINQGPAPLPPKIRDAPPRLFRSHGLPRNNGPTGSNEPVWNSGSSPPSQRRTSGFTGRRDDPTVGEETVEMRGVSYPGQEWVPERWD